MGSRGSRGSFFPKFIPQNKVDALLVTDHNIVWSFDTAIAMFNRETDFIEKFVGNIYESTGEDYSSPLF